MASQIPDCRSLEPLVTAWIDGAATDQESQAVEAHFKVCPTCRRRAETEGSMRELIRTRAPEAFRPGAPPHLKERCRALCSTNAAEAVPGRLRALRAFPIRFSMAAALVVSLVGALLYFVTASSTTTLAAQLTLDHVKCFVLTGDPTAPVKPDIVEAQLRERYGWTIDVPGDSEANQLRLIGGRRCLYGEGTVAHILYRHNGAPLSLFMLPDKVESSEIVDVMGHEAIIWAQNHRTFVLLGSEPRQEMEKIAGYIRGMVK